jgi:CheY-like chemotaxis protein
VLAHAHGEPELLVVVARRRRGLHRLSAPRGAARRQAEGLRAEALAVDVVYDGDAALDRLGVNDYDVLLLDRDLPVVHGDDVCRAVVDSGAHVRVLMLTAAVDVPSRVAGLSIGADDYLTKPFAFEELATTAHGGHVHAEPREGGGLTLTVRLAAPG